MEPEEQSPRSLRRAVVLADRAIGAAGGALRANHSRACRRLGLDGLRVVLSFDCDTDEDIDVVGGVHERLGALGVVPAYAVPGELLERGSDVYQSIAATGAEFLNHGFRQHCELDAATRTYVSSFFYDEIGTAAVEEDVRAGHDAVLRVLGQEPRGFRSPHFGTFQRPSQLRFLHRLLASLGYRYSSSTAPIRGLLRGPVLRTRAGVAELPVCGRRDQPRRVLDTWSFRFAPGRQVEAADYVVQVLELRDAYAGKGRPGVLNLYADPSQVADWPEFFALVGQLADHAVPSFASLLDEVRR